VAEGGGLLNRYTLQRRIEGSNPSVSASGAQILAESTLRACGWKVNSRGQRGARQQHVASATGEAAYNQWRKSAIRNTKSCLSR